VPGGTGGGAAGKRSGSGGGQQVTAAAWLGGGRPGDFATGHAGGDVCVWALPQATTVDGVAPEMPTGGQQPPAAAPQATTTSARRESLEPRLLSRLRIVAKPSATVPPPSWPVRHLRYLVSAKRQCILVLGGQEAGRPDALTLLPLPLPTEVCEKGSWSGENCCATCVCACTHAHSVERA
jgi:hypothetical protein